MRTLKIRGQLMMDIFENRNVLIIEKYIHIFLRDKLPHLLNRNINPDVCFRQDGAAPHYALEDRNYSKKFFEHRCICRADPDN